MTNLDRLIEAGVIPAEERDNISACNQEIIGTMTTEEVDSVISIFDKVGGRPFFEEMYCHAAFF